MSVDPDHELVEAAAGGSREAFDELVRRHQEPIVNLARAMTAGGSDADDLAQEAFVRAWKGIGRFRGDSTFRTWLHGVAVNVIRTHRARESRLRRLFFSPGRDSDVQDDPLEQAAVDNQLEASLMMRQGIDRALAQLPDELRESVVLRDVQGLEYQEIADVLGVPLGTVESRIFRGRQRLRPLLEAVRRT